MSADRASEPNAARSSEPSTPADRPSSTRPSDGSSADSVTDSPSVAASATVAGTDSASVAASATVAATDSASAPDTVTASASPTDSATATDAPTAAASAPPAAAPSPRELELAAELEVLRTQRTELTEKLLRTAADFDNYRKRARRELDEAKLRGRDDTIRDLLPIFDNLERAVAAAGSASEASAVVEGVRMVLKLFEDTTQRMGLQRVATVGSRFDPAVHEALQQRETDEQPPGTVLTEVSPGYAFGKRLLRAALVIVARAPSEPRTPSAAETIPAGAPTEPAPSKPPSARPSPAPADSASVSATDSATASAADSATATGSAAATDPDPGTRTSTSTTTSTDASAGTGSADDSTTDAPGADDDDVSKGRAP